MRMVSSVIVAVLTLVFVSSTTLLAQLPAEAPAESSGALIGVLFWTGITLLLLFGALLLLYEGTTHPNQR